jgi:hypothetical protein
VSRPQTFDYVWFDGERLSVDRSAGGRRLRIDARCLAGEGVQGAFAHVCALTDSDAALRFDEPEVQQARRDALAWWMPLLGDDLVCLSTFALDASRYAGAVTVARSPSCFVPASPGPVIERYSGTPWPGGSFEARPAPGS